MTPLPRSPGGPTLTFGPLYSVVRCSQEARILGPFVPCLHHCRWNSHSFAINREASLKIRSRVDDHSLYCLKSTQNDSFHWALLFTLRGRVRLNETRSEDRIPSHITACLEIVCQIVFMVRQVCAVPFELPAWNYIGNGKRGSKRIIKGQLSLQGREEEKNRKEC